MTFKLLVLLKYEYAYLYQNLVSFQHNINIYTYMHYIQIHT